MATLKGAEALHLDHLIGSLEPGKRADLILVDLNVLHSKPHFNRDAEAVYARLVYTSKSTDVTDVMVNGRWLMRNRELQTIDVQPLLKEADQYARRIDQFLTEREGSVLSKLVAIGGAEQQESYEVQIKIRLTELEPIIDRLESPEFLVLRRAHYMEYDTYFSFAEADQGRLRYREDEFIDTRGDVSNMRYRLTLIGPAAEREYPNSVLLSRSRFIAPAIHSLRFYREYFEPEGETEIHKDRLRWLVRFRGEEFFINIDELLQPELDAPYLEIKSRTWSRKDAEKKAQMISELLEILGLSGAPVVRQDYPEIVTPPAKVG